jgi:uncharacterized protein (DUF362 family)
MVEVLDLHEEFEGSSPILGVYLTSEEGRQYTIRYLNREAAFRLLKRMNWQPKTGRVLIKPNVGATSLRANTDPEVVRGIIKYLKSLDIRDIIIGEGAVVTEYESTDYNYHYCGWDRLAAEESVRLVDLNTCEHSVIPWRYGSLRIPALLKGRTYINVAKMKTHMQTGVSLCLKNQKGLLAPSARKEFHRLGLHSAIAHLAQAVQPELCMVDAVQSLEGSGPGNLGTSKYTGILIAGYDMLEVDRSCCVLMGIDPLTVEHIRILCELRGEPSQPNPENAKLIYEASLKFKLPEKEFAFLNTHMIPDQSACTACLSSVGKMSKLARRSWGGRLYFLRHGILRRLDIIVGNPPELPRDHGFCIFYGSCARKIAEKHPEYPYIGGCPPRSGFALETLREFDKKNLQR